MILLDEELSPPKTHQILTDCRRLAGNLCSSESRVLGFLCRQQPNPLLLASHVSLKKILFAYRKPAPKVSGDERELILSCRDTRKCWIDFPSNARKLLTSKKLWRLLTWTRTTSWTSKNGGQTWSRKCYVINAMYIPSRWGKLLLIFDNEAACPRSLRRDTYLCEKLIHVCVGYLSIAFKFLNRQGIRVQSRVLLNLWTPKGFFSLLSSKFYCVKCCFYQETINIPVGTQVHKLFCLKDVNFNQQSYLTKIRFILMLRLAWKHPLFADRNLKINCAHELCTSS